MFSFLSARSLAAMVFAVVFVVPGVLSANSLPAAETVTLEGVTTVTEGTVVVTNEELEIYGISSVADSPNVYGVSAALPPVVFATGENEVPVITEGIAFVRVSTANGEIARGDFLTTSETEGVAVRAGEEQDNVFAIALEAYPTENDGEVIQAEVGAERAQALRSKLQAQAAAASAEAEPEKDSFSWVRAGIATVVIVGGLFFVLYSFRSTIAHGVVSVGRNPRAKRSILTLSLANILFALLLCAVVIFIAIAILVLPL